VWPVPLAQVLPRPQTDFFFCLPKPGLFGIYLNFQWQKITFKNQYLSHSESKSYQKKIPLKKNKN